jgi:predicted acyltransferase
MNSTFPNPPQRLISLDVFRGLTIAGMILVNNPGTWSDVYPALRHAEWHGWTPTDFIFPFFLFIVGVSMTLSFKKRIDRGDDRKKLFMHAFQRSYIIFGLGLFLHLFPYFNFSAVRIPGVLQRIAVVYLLASIVYLYTDFKWQVYISLALLLLYWAAMALIPVPGYGVNNLSTEGNLAAYIDNKLLHGHMWKETWDPEGILSTFPAVVTTMIGIFTGKWIQKEKSHYETVSGMFTVGSLLLVVGSIWDMWFPINKYIWTSSYVVFMGGMALLFLGVCYYLIEIKNIKWWTQPFLVYGMNAIASFFLSSLMAKLLGIIKLTGSDGNEISLKAYIFTNAFSGFSTPMNSSLFFAIFYIIFWYLLMLILYRKKIFIKI